MQAVEHFFSTGTVNEQERWAFLRKHLGFDRTEETYTFGLYGGVHEAIKDYHEFIRSNRVVYPFSGGRREQPKWVTDNFETLDLLAEFFPLDKKYGPQVVEAPAVSPADALLGKIKLNR